MAGDDTDIVVDLGAYRAGLHGQPESETTPSKVVLAGEDKRFPGLTNVLFLLVAAQAVSAKTIKVQMNSIGEYDDDQIREALFQAGTEGLGSRVAFFTAIALMAVQRMQNDE